LLLTVLVVVLIIDHADSKKANTATVADSAHKVDTSKKLTPVIIEEPHVQHEVIQIPPYPIVFEQVNDDDDVGEDVNEHKVVQADAQVVADPELAKIDAALEAIKDDIISNFHELKRIRGWVESVRKILKAYVEKTLRVEDHIRKLKITNHKLVVKKERLINLKLQLALEKKLEETRNELNSLRTTLYHVQYRHKELSHSRSELEQAINSFQKQIAILRGETKYHDHKVKSFDQRLQEVLNMDTSA